MTLRRTCMLPGLCALLLLAALPAHAQIMVLGKGWLLDSAGSLTSTPGEVISGKNSIKGSFSGPDSGLVKPFLHTDPTFIHFTPNETYTIALSYRIITLASQGFQFGFFSSTAEQQNQFLPTAVITGAPGASGTATVTAKLESHLDVRAGFSVGGTGAIAIDDIRITNAAGELLVSEDAEGPTMASGPLNFRVTDAIAVFTDASASVISAAARDLDGDRYPETILALTAPRPSTTPLDPIIIEASGRMRLAASSFFPTGVPKVKSSPVTIFADINADGLQDILFADAGSDAEPFPGSGIGVGLNLGGGKYRDVSSLVPADLQTTRSYALAAGDLDGDGRVEIILADQNRGTNTALLRWNGNGFDAQRNWIDPSLWGHPENLSHQTWMELADFDKDGKQDLLVSGTEGSPNLRILFGGAGGFTSAGLLTLPDGPFGHTRPSSTRLPVEQGAEVGPVVVADLNNDGLPDIVALEDQIITYQPGVYTDTNDPDYPTIRAHGGVVYADVALRVFLNHGSRNFADVTPASSTRILLRGHYNALIPIDLNNDGFLDMIGAYQLIAYAGVRGGLWGSTVFLNDGTGAFQVVDGAQLLAAVTTTPSNGRRWNLGAFVPTVVTPRRTEGIVFDPLGGCGLGFCAATGLNLYKVVADGAIGTGPNFADGASLGVPGFNEFYYLRHYPDAAAAVQRGDYQNGLAHYLAVGKSKGYRAYAPRAAIDPMVSLSATSLQFGATNTGTAFREQTQGQAIRISQTGTGTVTWTATSSQPWLVVTPTSGTGPAVLTVTVSFHDSLPTSGQTVGAITLTFTGARNVPGAVAVTLTTKSNGSATEAFGSVDTPADNSTGVTGSIAVTGWALDDIEVRQVRILRDPVAGEESALIYIGNAVLVEGARPDVATLNPTLPRNTRGGWGYLLLTNFLPSLGNGTFKLYAFADDADGHSTLLGTKTIICTNATATNPFGAIDTPGQGATVSGTVNNFGWVLAHGSRRVDPLHGGTVQVIIDGAVVGSPTGWVDRADLNALFPTAQFSGVGNALGVYTFDSTTLSNGVHTISWVVTDNQGGAAGIGSRYFAVWNESAMQIAPASTLALRADQPRAQSIIGRRGPDLTAPFAALTRGVDAALTLRAEELDRIELQVQASGGRIRSAMGDLPLPIGSRIDTADGSFTWQPGPGFIGQYDLVFDTSNGPQRVRIILYPQGTFRRPQVVIDSPQSDSPISGSVNVAGWAVDPRTTIDTGIDAVHVWAYPARGGLPIFLGAATLGGARPDVAEIYGAQALNSGYELSVTTLPAGEYDVAVFASRSADLRFLPAATRRVVVR